MKASRRRADAGAMPSIGLFGGSFDPVHHGHLIVGQVAAEALGLDELRFVPPGSSRSSAGRHARPAADRAAMLELAVAGQPRLRGRAGGARAASGPRTRWTRSRRSAPGSPARLRPCCWVPMRPRSSPPGTGRPSSPGWPGSWCSRRPGHSGAGLAPDRRHRRGSRDRHFGHRDPPAGAGGSAGTVLGSRRRGGVYGPAPLIFGRRMIKNLMTAVFGTRFDRERRRIQPTVDAIHAEEEQAQGPERGRAQGPDRAFPGAPGGAHRPRSRPSSTRCAQPSTAAPTRTSASSWSSAFHELETGVQEGAGRRPGRAPAGGLRHRAGGLPPADGHHRSR